VRDAEATRIANKYADRLLTDGGTYGYGGEWLPCKEIDRWGLAAMIHEVAEYTAALIRAEEMLKEEEEECK
jgi:hypothetical protein